MYWTYAAINNTVGPNYMWQSQIEIEYYSAVFFKGITKFEAL